ncbi:beta-phosphoglucomutase [Namhaeicola litoreus]|uniref:Beta-phosphoglucomutase n=1 Tax=Namhaeicola litoreus TaxID=1052145 RepID=A0ABW3Y1N2_9FLAO
MNKNAFIFDLDGVIVDTAKFHYLAWKQLANELGFEFTEDQNEQLKGVSRVKSLEILLKIGNVSLDQDRKERLMFEKNERYLSYVANLDESEILPGIKNLLLFLKDKNIPIALGSASKNAIPILKSLALFDFFDTIVDGNDVSNAKPDPEVFLLAAKQLNIEPKYCFVVEDSLAGIQAANSVHMVSIGIGEKENLPGANHIFNSTQDLTVDFVETILN